MTASLPTTATSVVAAAGQTLPETPVGCLPPRMRILFITGAQRTGGWLAEAFANDSASEVELEDAVGMAAGLTRLRDDVFDAVLVSHEPGHLDALELLDAIRTGSSDEQPIIVLGPQNEAEMASLCYEAGCDAYICIHTTTTRALIWHVARAMERHRLISENRRLHQNQQHQLHLDHEEASRLLQQQRAMIADLERMCRGEDREGEILEPAGNCPNLPPQLVDHYRELLRAYVIMGSGNLGDEMSRLAELLSQAAVSAQQAMLLHLYVLEEMIRGLGSRSARHVMNRADLLVLEVMMNLAERYRERFLRRIHPPRQRVLPGFED